MGGEGGKAFCVTQSWSSDPACSVRCSWLSDAGEPAFLVEPVHTTPQLYWQSTRDRDQGSKLFGGELFFDLQSGSR